MSERFGMADGRCFTNYGSSRIMNDEIMQKNNIALADNHAFRQYIASGNGAVPAPVGGCISRDILPKVQDSRIDFIPHRQ